MYRTGTVSVIQDSHVVVGVDTFFQSVGSINIGYLFTIDGQTFYEITNVDSEIQIQIENIVTGLGYQGETIVDSQYAIVLPFGAGVNAQIAKNVIDLQAKWQQRERDITGWMNTDSASHDVESYTGEKVSIVSLQELTRLINAGLYPGANAWLDGSGAPSNALGVEGVFYLDRDKGDIYRKGSSAWSLIMTISGGGGSGGISAEEVFQLTHVQIGGTLIESLVSLLNSVENLGSSKVSTQALAEALAQLTQEHEQTNSQANSDLMDTVNELIHQVNQNAASSAASNDSMYSRLSFNHNHDNYPELLISNNAPKVRAFHSGVFHLSETLRKLWFSCGHKLDDWVYINTALKTRRFLVSDNAHYLEFDEPLTGSLTLRVWPFVAGNAGLPSGSPSLTIGSWQEFTVNVTDLDELFRVEVTSTVTDYWYGMVDYIRLGQRYDSTDISGTYLPALKAQLSKNSGWVGNPFESFELHQDGYWRSDDLADDTPQSISGGWQQIGARTFTCQSVSDGGVLIKPLTSEEYEGKTLELTVNVSQLSGVLSTTLSNSSEYYIRAVGTHILTMTAEDIVFKRGFGTLTCTVELISIRIKVDQ